MGKIINAYNILVVKLNGRDYSEDLGAGGRTALLFILREEGRRAWI
jgi:hypothetical protein